MALYRSGYGEYRSMLDEKLIDHEPGHNQLKIDHGFYELELIPLCLDIKHHPVHNAMVVVHRYVQIRGNP